MIKIKVKNVPSQANSWVVVIWPPAGDPEYSNIGLSPGGTYATYLPSGTYDLRFIGYSSPPGTDSYDPVSQRDLFGKNLVDGLTYVYDWSANTLTLATADSQAGFNWSKFFMGAGVAALILTPVLFLKRR